MKKKGEKKKKKKKDGVEVKHLTVAARRTGKSLILLSGSGLITFVPS